MKICFFHSSLEPGGIERTISILSNLYVKKNNDIYIITLDSKDSFYILDPNVKRIKLDLMGASTNSLDAIKNTLTRAKKLRKAIKAIMPDVIITFGPSTELIGLIGKRGLNIKIIGAEQGNPYVRTHGIWNKNKKFIARFCDGFIFQTQGAMKYYSKCTQKKSIIFQNGLSCNDFIENKKNWNDRSGICAVGRLIESKCFDDLIKAFKLVVEKNPNVILDIYGDGNERKSLEEVTAQLGIANNIKFHGNSNEILKQYAMHKIFVMSSSQEGLPNVLLEAMASGCACVSTNCDFGPSEIIEDGVNGYLVEVHDYESMAAKIIELLKNDNIAESFSIKASEILKTHDIRVLGDKLYNYIEKIVE